MRTVERDPSAAKPSTSVEAQGAGEAARQGPMQALLQRKIQRRLASRGAGTTGPTTGLLQRKEADAIPALVTAPPSIDAVVLRLNATAQPTFAGVVDKGFDIAGVLSWMEALVQLLGDAKAVSAGQSNVPLTQALEKCLAANGPVLERIAAEIRKDAVQLTSDSSVAKKDPAKVTLPTAALVKKLGEDAGALNRMTRDVVFTALTSNSVMAAAASTAEDAALTLMQSLAVSTARERWSKGTATESDKAGNGKTELDHIIKDSGWGNSYDKGTEWCGLFVVSSMYQGPGLAKALRSGFYEVNNVNEFFTYRREVIDAKKRNDDRVPMQIWAEDRWWNLEEYHKARGTLRSWTPRETIRKAIAGGGAANIRPGDTCLVDHGGGDSPSHIVMVESYDAATGALVTIEGNTYGIHVDKDKKAERVDDDHLKESQQGGGTAAGIHVRDLRTLAPGPGDYVVTDGDARVRDEADLTKPKMDKGKPVVIPKAEKVVVTELKDVGGKKYANVKDWGWTAFANLGTGAAAVPVKDGYQAKKGSTVYGVGRPSMVDFEDGHQYAINPVPDSLKTTSPDQLREMAKHKNKEGQAARAVGLK